MSHKLSYALIAGLAFSIVESMPAHALVATPNGFAPSPTNPCMEVIDAGDSTNPEVITTASHPNSPCDGFVGTIGGLFLSYPVYTHTH